MDPVSALGAAASIVQLASAAISLSKALYTVGSAISSAPEDIQSLAEDLEDFAGSLNIFSRLLGDSESFYSDDIYLCAAKIMRDASNLYVKIQRLVGKLGKGGWKARVRWGFREGEVRKLMARLRDMKGSLVHITVSLHLDLELSRLGISSGSKLQRGDRVLRPETIERLEEASRVVKENDLLIRNSPSPDFRDKPLAQPTFLSLDSKSRSERQEEREIDWHMTSLKIGSNQDDLITETSVSAAKGLLPVRTATHDMAISSGPTRVAPTARGLMATRKKSRKHTSAMHEISLRQNSKTSDPQTETHAALNRPTVHDQSDQLTGSDNRIHSTANAVTGESSGSVSTRKGFTVVEEATQFSAVGDSVADMTRKISDDTATDLSRKPATLSTTMRIPPPPPMENSTALSAAMGIPTPPQRQMIRLMAFSQSTIEPANFASKKVAPSLKSLPSIDSFKSAVSVQNQDAELKIKIEEDVKDILHAFQTARDVLKNTVDEKAPRSWEFETATNLLKVRLGDGWATINGKYNWHMKDDESQYFCDFKEVDVKELEKISPMLMTGIVVELHMHSTKPDSFREGLFKRLCSVSEDCRVKASFQLEKIRRTSLYQDLEWKKAKEYFPPMTMKPEHSLFCSPPKEKEEFGKYPTMEELFPDGLLKEGNLPTGPTSNTTTIKRSLDVLIPKNETVDEEYTCPLCYKTVLADRPSVFNDNNCSCVESSMFSYGDEVHSSFEQTPWKPDSYYSAGSHTPSDISQPDSVKDLTAKHPIGFRGRVSKRSDYRNSSSHVRPNPNASVSTADYYDPDDVSCNNSPQMNAVQVNFQPSSTPPYMVPLPPVVSPVSSSGSPGRKGSKPFRATASQSDAGLVRIMGNRKNIVIARQAGAEVLAAGEEMENEAEEPTKKIDKSEEGTVGGLINLVSTKKPKRRESTPFSATYYSMSRYASPDHDLTFKDRPEHLSIVGDTSSSKRPTRKRNNTRPKYIPQAPKKLESKDSDVTRPFLPTTDQSTANNIQDSKPGTWKSPSLTPVGEEVFRKLMGLDEYPLPTSAHEQGTEIGQHPPRPELQADVPYYSRSDDFGGSWYPWEGKEESGFCSLDHTEFDHDFVEFTKEVHEDKPKNKSIDTVRETQEFEATKTRIEVTKQEEDDDQKLPEPAQMKSSENSKGDGKRVARKPKNKTNDWSEITDPEERRRVQNRIAQRKFRDKAKESKEREERDAQNRAHAGHSYYTSDPQEMGGNDDPSGLPWGSLSLKHVVPKSRRTTSREEPRRPMGQNSYQQAYKAGSVSLYKSPIPSEKTETSSAITMPSGTYPGYQNLDSSLSRKSPGFPLSPTTHSYIGPRPEERMRLGLPRFENERQSPLYPVEMEGEYHIPVIAERQTAEFGHNSRYQEHGHPQHPPPIRNHNLQTQRIEETQGDQHKGSYQLHPPESYFRLGSTSSYECEFESEKDSAPEKGKTTKEKTQPARLSSTYVTSPQQPSSETRLSNDFTPPWKDFYKLIQERIEQLSEREQARLQATPRLPKTWNLWTKTQSSLQDKHPQLFSSLNSNIAKRTTIIFPTKVLDNTGKSLLTLSWEASFEYSQVSRASSGESWIIDNVVKEIITTIFAVENKIGLEMSSFAWNCIWMLLIDYHRTLLLPTVHTALEFQFKVLFTQLQDIVGVLARYAVMENLYLQTPILTVRADYEDKMVAMCVIILRYFEKSFTTLQKFTVNQSEDMVADMLELSQLIEEVKSEDEACQKFVFTIDEVDYGGSESENGFEEFDSSDENTTSIGGRSGVIV